MKQIQVMFITIATVIDPSQPQGLRGFVVVAGDRFQYQTFNCGG